MTAVVVIALRAATIFWWLGAATAVITHDYTWAVINTAGMAFSWVFSYNYGEFRRRASGRHERSGR